jgi:NAD(P)H-flavin reductase
MLYVFGVGEIPISISGNPTKPGLLVHTIRAVGTVSRMMQELKPKDVIGVRGPFGSHWPLEQATGKDIVIVAGGIGLAPLRSTLYQIMAQRERYGRVSLIYGARTPDDILYHKECERWQKRSDLDVYLTVDRATSSWEGSVGLVTKLIPRASFDPLNTMALICGPEVMMRFSALELEKRDVASENIFLSMERNMKCAIGFCGRCQYSGSFVCKDGPVFSYRSIQDLLIKREI